MPDTESEYYLKWIFHVFYRNTKIQDETDLGPIVKANISEKKSTVKMDPVKDFGNFSSLMAPALLSGKKTR